MLLRISAGIFLVILNLPLRGFSRESQSGELRQRQVTWQSLNVGFGLVSPLGRAGLREFWGNGIGAAGEFLIHPNPYLGIGVGGEIGMLYFDLKAFSLRWPGVDLTQKQNLTVGSVYLTGVYSFLPASDVRPFVGGQAGVFLTHEALYREVIDGVRHTYYNAGGTTRLAAAAVAGADIHMSYWLGIHIELKGALVHNDPVVGALLFCRAGIQYKF